jgi:hypothetical protein
VVKDIGTSTSCARRLRGVIIKAMIAHALCREYVIVIGNYFAKINKKFDFTTYSR